MGAQKPIFIEKKRSMDNLLFSNTKGLKSAMVLPFFLFFFYRQAIKKKFFFTMEA